MKIYLDLVMFINFFLDFILLLGVSVTLKRNVNIKRAILSAFTGGISILILFMKMDNITLFLFKFLISILMILIAFGYKDFKYTLINTIYLYILSIFLGGFLYFLNDQLCLKRNNFIFVNNGFSITILVVLILSPIVIYLYVKQSKCLKNNYNNYYSLSIYIKDYIINCVGFVDSGNSLTYLNKSVILLDKRKIIKKELPYLYIPYETITENSVIKGFKPNKVIIEGRVYKNILVGIADVNIDGVDVLLNNNMEMTL